MFSSSSRAAIRRVHFAVAASISPPFTTTSARFASFLIHGDAIDRSAHQLSAFVDEVLAESGAEKVDVLGHSLGTLVAAYWIRFLEGAAKVDRNVSLAPLWHGTDLIKGDGLVRDAQYAVCPACSEMHPDSDFIDRLHTAGPFVDSVAYTNILTERDTHTRR
ncbi:lipase family alpha/beta hydrolase [Rhodococcus zopfii]|uniref:lipase family alpha/beta hydrolase n=1 Tax=Rhodococcus zopfii TaxID=43772 RepID=UPI000B248CC8|nr:alpha/beta hydrolase [Rhodococcus zopfii]